MRVNMPCAPQMTASFSLQGGPEQQVHQRCLPTQPEARRHAWAMAVSAAFLTSHLRSLSPLERTYFPQSHLSPANDWPQKG